MTAEGFKPPSYYGQPPRRAPSRTLVAAVAGVLVIVLGVGLALALKIGPFAPVPTNAGASPAPIASPQTGSPTSQIASAPPGSSTPAPTITPTEVPAPSDGPATPNTATGELMSHVPDSIRPSCLPTDFLEPILAMVSCAVGDGQITVEYAKYPDADSMYAAYNERVRTAQIETDSGLCFTSDGGTISATPNRWPAEHQYNVDGQPVGRYLCVNPPLGIPSINWTDDRLQILGVASTGPTVADRLASFWVNDSGPIQ
jgi:hypothetical protein